MNLKKSFMSLPGASLMVIVACGCAPTLHLAVEHRDGGGNLVERLVTKPGDPDMQVHNWSASHTLDAIADAQFRDGLESMSIGVSGNCFDRDGAGNPQAGQPFGYGLPTTGNPIPAGQNPTTFTFRQRLDTTCAKAGLEFRVNATATGLPSKNAGAATVTTGDIVLKR